MKRLQQITQSHPYYVMVAVLLLAGGLISWVMAYRADQQMRANFLDEARVISQEVYFSQVNYLKASPADLDSSVYKNLKQHLIDVRQVHPQYRFLYLMGRTPEGEIFFFMDSESSTSPDYSPPGQIYSEAPAGIRAVFDNPTARVMGPLTDRWGTWVSALVPLIDPASGAVIAVERIDIPLNDWNIDLISRIALPLWLLLGLGTILLTLVMARRQQENPVKLVMQRLMLPIAVIAIGVMAGTELLFWQQQIKMLDSRIAPMVSDVEFDLQSALNQQTSSFEILAKTLSISPDVRQALLEGDTARLMTLGQPMYEMLGTEYGSVEFNFLDARRTCLLSFNSTRPCSGTVNTFTTLKAARTAEPASGQELGPQGRLSLWVVQPVYVDGKLAGYVEFGKDAQDGFQSAGKQSGTQLAVIIHKQYLNQADWQTADWDRLPGGVVTYNSLGRLPEAFSEWASQTALDETYLNTGMEITSEGKPWRVASLPLMVASGEQVGHLLVMIDVSAQKVDFNRHLILAAAVGGALLGILLALIFLLLYRADQFVFAQQKKLANSEQRFRKMFLEHAAVMLLVEPNSGRIVDANISASQFYGYSMEQLKSMQIDQLNSMDAGQVAQERLRALEHKQNYFTFPHRLASGEIREVEAYSTPIDFGGETVLFSIIRDITQRRQAEKDLRESQQLLSSLMKFSPVYMYVKEVTPTESRTLIASENFVEMIGIPGSAMAGKTMGELFPPEMAAKITADDWAAVSSGKVLSLDEDFNNRSYTTIKFPIQQDGRILLAGFTLDITENKLSEIALKASEARFRAVTQSARDAIVTVDSEGQIVGWNRGAENIFGYSETEAFRLRLDALLPVAFEQPHRPGMVFSMGGDNSGPKKVIEGEGRRKDGQKLQLEISLSDWQVENGLFFTAIARDISERKRAEAKLENNERRFRALLENSSDGLAVLDERGNLVYSGPENYRLTGYSSGEFIGTRILDLFFPEDQPRLREVFLGVAAFPFRKETLETRLVKKGGRLAWVEITLTNLLQQPDVTGIVVNFHDITASKQAEYALKVQRDLAISLSASDSFVQMLQSVIDALRKIGGLDCGGIYLVDTESGDLDLVAHSGLPPAFVADASHYAPDSPNARLVKAGSPIFRPYIEVIQETGAGPIRQHEGLRALALMPIQHGGSVIACINLASHTQNEISSDERILIETIGAQIGGTILRLSTEKVLQAREEEYRNIVENSPIGIFHSSLEGRYLTANPALAKILGYASPQELLEQVTDIQAQIYVGDGARARILDQISSQTEWSFGEMLCRKKDGSLITVEWNGRKVFNPDGTVAYLEGFFRDITARKTAEQELRESEAKLSQAQRLAHLGSWEYDMRTKKTHWSEELYQIFGVERDFVIPPGFQIQIIHPDDRAALLRAQQIAQDNRLPFEITHRIILPNGNLKFVQINQETEYDQSGQPLRFMGTVQDVTEIKQIEAELRRSQANLLLAQRIANYGNWEIDWRERLTTWSEEVYRIFGMDAQTFTPQTDTYQNFVHPDDRAAYDEAINNTLKYHTPYRLSHRVVLNDGSVKYVAVDSQAIFDEDGAPLRILGTIQDITDRKQAEAALSDSETRYRSLFDDSPISLWEEDYSEVGRRLRELRAQGVTDLEDYLDRHPEFVMECIGLVRINNVNKATLELFGAVSKENLLDNLSVVLPASASAGFRSELLWIDAGLTRYSLEMENITLQGGLITVFVNWAVMPGYQESLSRVIVSLVDVTERRRAEQKLEESVRTAQRYAAQAEQANMAKSEFLANMSHEIRTPMNGVIGMARLLLDTNLDDEQQRYAEAVHSSGEALLTLLNDILDLSKIEAGRLDLETLDFDLLTLMDEIAASMAVRAQMKGLELLCSVAPDVPCLLNGDPTRLRQVLGNLVVNAIKFTQHGEINLRVQCVEAPATKTAPDEVELRFSVSDTGIGIAPEKMGVLFNKFTQVDASTTRQYGGTGLGLAISKQLVELMGGRIGAQSEPGQGSEFWFTIRVHRRGGCDEQGDLHQTALENVRVLVADDSASSREMLVSRLTAWGMRPAEAADAAAVMDALAAAWEQGDPFRMAILGLQLPDMDAIELGQVIKRDRNLSATHLILLSPLGTQLGSSLSGNLNFDGYLNKPLRYSVLFNILLEALIQHPESPLPAKKNPAAGKSARGTGSLRPLPVGPQARILLVEDNLTNQQVARAILIKLGLEVVVASNGVEALSALQQNPFQLVLMDVQMPVMDGLETTRRIRDGRGAVLDPHIPIIAMTAHAMQDDRDRCLAAGMNDYLSKPIKPRNLSETLLHWLSGRNLESLPALPPESAPQKAPPAEAGSVVFDQKALFERLMNDDELVKIVVQGFLQDMPLQIQTLKDYLAAQDLVSAERQAHTIKGAAANLSGEMLRKIAAEMEKEGKQKNLPVMRARLDELDLQFARLKDELERVLSARLG